MTDAVQTLAAALAAGQVEVVDLTQPLSEDTPVLRLPEPFANTPRFRLRELSRYDERGPAWHWNAFEGGEHTGTHLDAFTTAAKAAIAADELACLVAKVEAVGPKSFHMDLHLLENRFEFQRALRPDAPIDPQGAPP